MHAHPTLFWEMIKGSKMILGPLGIFAMHSFSWPEHVKRSKPSTVLAGSGPLLIADTKPICGYFRDGQPYVLLMKAIEDLASECRECVLFHELN